MPRINQVKKARKDQGKCGRCGTAILAGTAYFWIKFRHGGRRIRCTDPSCRFRASDLTQSKMSGAYAAQEEAQDSLAAGGHDIDGLKSLAEETADAIQEVADEYQESADAISCEFDSSPTAEACEEKAGELGDWADMIRDSLSDFEEFEPSTDPENPECEECGGPMTEREGDDGTWDCNDPECGERGITFELDTDDEGRTEEEWTAAAQEALESALGECPC